MHNGILCRPAVICDCVLTRVLFDLVRCDLAHSREESAAAQSEDRSTRCPAHQVDSVPMRPRSPRGPGAVTHRQLVTFARADARMTALWQCIRERVRRLSVRKFQLPLDRLESRLLAQRIEKRVCFSRVEARIAQSKRGFEPSESLARIAPLRINLSVRKRS